MADKIKVSLKTGISSDKKDLISVVGKKNNDGMFNTHVVEAIPQYNEAEAEKVIQGPGNQFIILGRDRPRGITSGYGGAGHTHSACIDIIAGLSGIMSREATSDGEIIVTDKSPEHDAARIYISQRTNIDDYFHLSEGTVGKSEARAGIAVKADDVRLIARNGIKLVTGSDSHEASGLPSLSVGGIDLIAGNDDSDLQPLVKGNNLSTALEELADLVTDLNGLMFSMVKTYVQLTSALAVHTHISTAPGYPTSPSVDLAMGMTAQLTNLTTLSTDLLLHQKNLVGWGLNTLYPWGENYFKSSYNNTN